MASITNKNFSNHFKNLKDRMSKRRHLNLSMPNYVTARGQSCFRYQIPTIWSCLPVSLRSSVHSGAFGWVVNSICWPPWSSGVVKWFFLLVIFSPYPFTHTRVNKLNQKHGFAPWLAMLLSAWATYVTHLIYLITWIPMYKSEVTDKMKICCML